MRILLAMIAAVSAYCIGGWNPAITFSKAFYHQDIRNCGSKNPGFTNFRRTFGNRWAWWVLLLDLTKAAIVAVTFGKLFEQYFNGFQFGAAYTGIFALLGHAFPIWYRFRGGKGFLVCLSCLWVIDWRVGAIATLLMVILLLTTHYMSLSTVIALLCSPILLYLFGAPKNVLVLSTVMVCFVAVRHQENFKRLRCGTESKFVLHSKTPLK